ncbi:MULTISPECIES: hypothetical protein [unclassified Moraxella]|uniref:hypothetical protein n=1 Tax=unclassified Moraxella TaxID=2685852 RepID=UPI003AF7F954
MNNVSDDEKYQAYKKLKGFAMNNHLPNQPLANKQSLIQDKMAKTLAIISLVLWVISLCLVGFASSDEGVNGYLILILGIFAGWAKLVWWTVYSNLFYIYAQFKFLIIKRNPSISVILMMILGTLLIYDFFIDVPMLKNENGGITLITSWGWGAIILLVSQFLMGIAMLLQHHKISKKVSYILLSMLMILVVGVGFYGYWQRQHTNQWEYETFFAPQGDYDAKFSYVEIAFTKAHLTNYPYIPIRHQLASEATVEVIFETDVPKTFKDNEFLYPYTFWQNGKYWEVAHKSEDNSSANIEFIEIPKVDVIAKPTYQLKVTQPKNNLYVYTLYDLSKNILYQQAFTLENDKYKSPLVRTSVNMLPSEIRELGKDI